MSTSTPSDFMTTPFEAICYRQKLAEPGPTIIHTHGGLELAQNVVGEGHVLIDNKVYAFKPGMVALVNGRNSHCVRPYRVGEYVRNQIHFSAEYLLPLLENMGQTDLLDPFYNKNGFFGVVQLPQDVARQVDEQFQMIAKEDKEDAYGRLPAITAHLLQILLLVRRYAHNEATPLSNDSHYLHTIRVIDYVGENLADFDLTRLSEELGLSKYYLCHTFKRATGSTIWQYVLERKIARAKTLLATGVQPVSQVGQELGFSSFSLFSRSFKRLAGISPSAFRKQYYGVDGWE